MANRYRNRNYGRGERRGDYGYRSSRYGRRDFDTNYDIDRYGSSRFGGNDYDRQENYFGGGNLGYGSGYTGSDYDRGYSSYNRDFEEDFSDYNQPSNAYTGGYGRNRGYDRESYYGGGFDRDYDYDRDYYGESSYGRGRFGSDYGRNTGYGNYGSRGYTGRRGYDYDREDYGYRGRSYDRGYESDYDRDERGWFDKAADEVASWFGDEEAERRRRRDARNQGYRGRGPRNYSRSDERIKEDINDRLTDDFYLDASDIDVEVSNGEVTLTGTVESRFAKRRAEDIAEDVSGVSHLENRLRVNENFYDQESSYTETSGTSKTSVTDTTTDTTNTKSRSKTA